MEFRPVSTGVASFDQDLLIGIVLTGYTLAGHTYMLIGYFPPCFLGSRRASRPLGRNALCGRSAGRPRTRRPGGRRRENTGGGRIQGALILHIDV